MKQVFLMVYENNHLISVAVDRGYGLLKGVPVEFIDAEINDSIFFVEEKDVIEMQNLYLSFGMPFSYFGIGSNFDKKLIKEEAEKIKQLREII